MARKLFTSEAINYINGRGPKVLKSLWHLLILVSTGTAGHFLSNLVLAKIFFHPGDFFQWEMSKAIRCLAVSRGVNELNRAEPS